MNEQQTKSKVSAFQANFIPVASVTLVLWLLGMVVALGFLGNNLTREVMEKIGFTVTIRDEATPEQIQELRAKWQHAPYFKSEEYTSKEAALAEYKRMTGEDLIEMTGVNPLSAEYEVCVKSPWASTKSLNKITSELAKMPAVEEISVQKDLVNKVNENLRFVEIVLVTVAAVLILISFALINNTIRLSVYSKRFIIYTMRLVGAKPSFIRKPFILRHLLNGIIASVIAIAILSAMIAYVLQYEEFKELLTAQDIAIVYVSVLLMGIIICSLAAMMASNKYINLDYDKLFKQ